MTEEELEKQRKYQREYYQKNKEKCRSKRRRQYRKHIDKEHEYSKKYAATGATRNNRYKHSYGITAEEVDGYIAAQDGKCVICNLKRGKLHVDHEHVKSYSKMSAEDKKKHIRGFICFYCNRFFLARGMSVKIAKKIIEYLEAYDRRKSKGTS